MSILHAYHSKLPFRNLKGKPFVVVSPYGISNGSSNIYNDGADFGPDTLLNATAPDQYGPPYSNTNGIQEALNYAAAIVAPVELGPGTFPVSTAILLPAIGNGLFLRGASEHLTTIEQAPGYAGTIMQWANPNTYNTMYYFGHFRLYGPNGGGSSVWLMDLKQNEVAAEGLIEQIRIVHENVSALRLDGNEDTITIKMDIDNGGTGYVGVSWGIPAGSAADFESIFASGAIITAQKFDFFGTVFGENQLLTLIPVSQPAIINFWGSYWNWSSSHLPQIYITGATNTSNTYYLNFIGCIINPNSQNLGNPFLYNSTAATITVFAKFINSMIQSSSTVPLFGAVSGGVLNGYAEFDDLTQPLTNVNVNNVAVSTPSVPASGTAQANGNSFPVTVYLSGGSATQVQITKYGNTYTIWSASTATAIPPLTIRLNPGDSITITYSTAPTWTWTAA